MKDLSKLPLEVRAGPARVLGQFWAGQAMNMRAAEASVSKVPKPIKILPISEVLSQVELAVLPALAATTTGGLAGGACWASTGAAAASACCTTGGAKARSTSLS